MKKKIFIRLGHDILIDGACTGAVGYLNEYEVIRKYGFPLADQLRHFFDVRLFNSTPATFRTSHEASKAGIDEANKWNAELFISCHVNKFNGKAKGTEVCCSFEDPRSKLLATQLSNIISETLKTANRGAKDRIDLSEIKKTKMSAIIIEPFFIDNNYDCSSYKEIGPIKLAEKISTSLIKHI